MTYISWLLEKLREEIQYDGPDVLILLNILKRCANNADVKRRYDAMAQAWNSCPRHLARRFVLLQTQLMDNRHTDARFQGQLNAINREILWTLLSDFIQKRVFKIDLQK